MKTRTQSINDIEQIDKLEPLRWAYGHNKLVLLIRDPQCLFVYWEITPELRAMIELHFEIPWEQAQLSARVLVDLDGYGQSLKIVSETAINRLADNWYFPVESGRRFQVILGLRSISGDFIPLLESNLIELGDNLEHPTLIPIKQASGWANQSVAAPITSRGNDYPLGIYSASHLIK
ncbi:MAG: DUF4912 domain-containing protein [Carboxydocellales bacterium]